MHLLYTSQTQLSFLSYRAHALCANIPFYPTRRPWPSCHSDYGGIGSWLGVSSQNKQICFSGHTLLCGALPPAIQSLQLTESGSLKPPLIVNFLPQFTAEMLQILQGDCYLWSAGCSQDCPIRPLHVCTVPPCGHTKTARWTYISQIWKPTFIIL